MKRKLAILVVGAIMAVPILSACSFSADGAADPAYRTLRYEGGDFKGSKFKACLDEGEKLASNDRFYSYPNTQRQDKWDTANFGTGANSADYADLGSSANGQSVTDKNGVPMSVKMTVPFTLNTSCDPIDINGKHYPGGAIQAFHEIFGKTRNGYFDPTVDGNTSYGKGWLWLMDTYISNCTTQQVIPKVRADDAQTMWLDDTVRQDMGGAALQAQIQACVNNAMETDVQFYTIGFPTIDALTPGANFVKLFNDRREAEIQADTAKANEDAQVAEAKAKAAVALEEAKVKQAEISGYGGFDNYVCIYMADQGLNCKQPQYVVSGSK